MHPPIVSRIDVNSGPLEEIAFENPPIDKSKLPTGINFVGYKKTHSLKNLTQKVMPEFCKTNQNNQFCIDYGNGDTCKSVHTSPTQQVDVTTTDSQLGVYILLILLFVIFFVIFYKLSEKW